MATVGGRGWCVGDEQDQEVRRLDVRPHFRVPLESLVQTVEEDLVDQGPVTLWFDVGCTRYRPILAPLRVRGWGRDRTPGDEVLRKGPTESRGFERDRDGN